MTKRILFALCASVVFSACGGTSGGDGSDAGASGGGGNSTDAGGTGGNDGGNNGGNDGGGTVTAAPTLPGFTAQVAQTFCSRGVSCGQFGAAVGSDCDSYLRTVLPEIFFGATSGTDGGPYTYDRAAASECLEGMFGDGGCEALTSPTPAACREVLVGKVQDGGLCHGDSECSGRAQCVGQARCQQVCAAVGRLGELCPSFDACDDHLYCQQDAGRCAQKRDGGPCSSGGPECDERVAYCAPDGGCAPYPGPGELCANGASQRCRSDAYCEFLGTTCRAYGAVGTSCNIFAPCVEGLYCYDDGGTQACQQRRTLGQTCDTAAFGGLSCVDGLYCSTTLGTCQNKVAVGSPCESSFACQSGAECDSVTRRCEVYAQNPNGQRCTNNVVSCESRHCEGASENPDGGVGTVGACRASQAGDGCFGEYDCTPFLSCAFDGGTGTCFATTIGSSCQEDQACPQGAYCRSPDGTCQTIKTAGQVCATNERCTPPLDCVAGSVGGQRVCGVHPDIGAPCDTGAQSPCRVGGICQPNTDGGWGTCVPGARLGLPCDNGCFTGACRNNPDGGTGKLCVPALADGLSCQFGLECASGHCSPYDRTCQSACF